MCVGITLAVTHASLQQIFQALKAENVSVLGKRLRESDKTITKHIVQFYILTLMCYTCPCSVYSIELLMNSTNPSLMDALQRLTICVALPGAGTEHTVTSLRYTWR